jgi:oligopeptide/dipeptide ABC transporter ATP-binding protein
MRDDLLEITDLKTHFFLRRGVLKAVDGISLSIGEKEIVGLVGESGCGKSQTALSIMRLIQSPPGRMVDGRILFRGDNLLDFSEKEMRNIRGKEISMIFQDPMTFLNPIKRVGDQIREAISLHQNVDKREAKKLVIEVLNDVKISSPSEVYDYYPHQLSGGMKQRVLISIALSCNPSLLLADEPTTNLDVTIQSQILELIKKLVKDRGISLLLITHDLGIVAEICDVIYVMYAGRIMEKSDVFTLFKSPRHPYTQGLLKSMVSINEYKKTLVSIEGTVPDLIHPPSGCRFHPRCPNAMDVCREEAPGSIELEEGHTVSCWKYG